MAVLPAGGATIDSVGTFGALIIFAKFPDGADIDPNGTPRPTCSCGDEWLATDTTVPAWADSLIDSTAAARRPGSLTDYFYTWSQGKHVLQGAVLNTVIALDSTIAYYAAIFPTDPLYAANLDVLAKAEQLIDFSQFDIFDSDDRIDQVFIQYHSAEAYDSTSSTHYSLWPSASAYARIIATGSPPYVTAQGDTVCSGVMLWHLNRKGTIVRGKWIFMNEMAHEYGHLLRTAAGITGRGHVVSAGRYSIMQGNFPTGLVMHGEVRRQLNWIDPPRVHASSIPFDTTLTLSASYLDHDATFAIIEPDTSLLGHLGTIPPFDKRVPQYFLLEARRSGLAGEVYSVAQPASCCLKTVSGGSGLLITHVVDYSVYNNQGKAWWSAATDSSQVPAIDIEVADGAFDTTTEAPDPILGLNLLRTLTATNYASVGGVLGSDQDLYSDQTVGGSTRTNALTPYTNPNTNLYENELGGVPNWHQTIYSGISLYDIEWTSAAKEAIRVKVHFGPIAAPDSADTIRVDTTWQGLMQLTGDVVVDSAATLTVTEDAMVIAKAGSDRFAAGRDTSGVEIEVLGKLVVAGADSTARFTSSRDDGFVHWNLAGRDSALGETTAAAPGDWHGIRLFDAHDYDPGTGSFTVSDIERAEIRYPTFAMTVDSLSGNILDCEFAEADSADILLERDTRIPEGKEWSLKAPTRVVVANSDAGATGTDTNRVELHVNGYLKTYSLNPGTDWVTFEPKALTATTGDGWAGILVYDAGLLTLQDADVGYATTPVSLLGTPYCDVVGCNIHHYEDEGILDWGSHAQIQQCTVMRGSELFDGRGTIGIHLALSAGAVTGNTVGWHEDYGIKAEFNSGSCGLPIPPAPRKTLAISNNVLDASPTQTEPQNEDADGAQTAILVSWACDSLSVVLNANDASYWERGLFLNHCADTDVTCSFFENNFVGIQYERGSAFPLEPGNDVVRVDQTASRDNFGFAIQVPTGVGLVLGDTAAPPDPGRNSLQLDIDSLGTSKYIKVVDVDPDDPSAVLEASRNTWKKHDGSITQSGTYIHDHIVEDTPASVAYANPKSAETLCSAAASVTSGALVAEDPERSSVERLENGPELPSALAFRRPFPNPTRGGVRWEFDVPEGYSGVVEIQAFDVTGRLVRTFHRQSLPPGRYTADWTGLDDQGLRTAPGTYFVRMVAGEFRKVHKLTVVR